MDQDANGKNILILYIITGDKGIGIDLPGSTGLRGELGFPGESGTNCNSCYFCFFFSGQLARLIQNV